MGNFYGKYMEVATRALDWSVTRNRVIASNIANKDTPGYKAKDVDFKKMFNQAMGNGMQMSRTNPRHLPPAFSSGTPLFIEKEGEARVDGNNVNSAEEMAHMVENNFLYQTLTRFVSGKFKSIKSAIGTGG